MSLPIRSQSSSTSGKPGSTSPSKSAKKSESKTPTKASELLEKSKSPKPEDKPKPKTETIVKPIVVDIPELPQLRAMLIDNPENFSVSSFVDKLMKPLMEFNKTKQYQQDFGFDPVALHELFTGTLDRLAKLGKELDDGVKEMSLDGVKRHQVHKKEMDHHNEALHEVRLR